MITYAGAPAALCLMSLLVAGMSSCLEASAEMTEQRLLMPNAWASWVPDTAAMRDFVDAWTSRGVNGCGLQIPWDAIEPEEGRFDWTWLDERLDVVVDAGLRVHLRLATQNHRPGWVDSELMCGRGGEVVGAGNWNMLSFADPRTAGTVSSAMGAVAAHVQQRYAHVEPHPVVCILPQFSGPAETEYAHDRWSDFSDIAQKDFRAWLRKRHGTVDEVNFRWRALYADWDQITLQAAHPWDFNSYRTARLSALIEACADAVHEVAGQKMGVQFGSIWDGISVCRGTRDARALIEHTDWVVIDDYPLYDHAMSMDYLRGHAHDKMWGNEVDGPGIVPDEMGLEQCLTSLERGARFLWVANWPADSIRDGRWTFWEKVMAVMAEPYQPVEPDRAIVVSLATAYRQEGGQGVEGLFIGLYRRLTDGGAQPVDIITDTVLTARPEWLARYESGLHIPSSQLWMSDELVRALSDAPVPVYVEGDRVGLLDAYGMPRPVEDLPRSAEER